MAKEIVPVEYIIFILVISCLLSISGAVLSQNNIVFDDSTTDQKHANPTFDRDGIVGSGVILKKKNDTPILFQNYASRRRRFIYPRQCASESDSSQNSLGTVNLRMQKKLPARTERRRDRSSPSCAFPGECDAASRQAPWTLLRLPIQPRRRQTSIIANTDN